MGYIKAHITSKIRSSFEGYWKDDVTSREGGFYTHGIIAVIGTGDSKTEIIFQEHYAGQNGDRGIQRKALVNLPIDKVNILLEHLEIEGGVLDLLLHTCADNPKSIETPVPHKTGQGRSLMIDFNNLSDPGQARNKRLLNPPLPPPSPPPADTKKPFRPFGGL